MHALAPSPRRLPQRVVVAGTPGEQLTTFIDRLAAALDLPSAPLDVLAGATEVATLAAFDGWVTAAEPAWARPVLLARADLLVHPELEARTLGGRVRRTLRRMRSDAREPDLTWMEGLGLTHPGLEVLRLPDPDAVQGWLHGYERAW